MCHLAVKTHWNKQGWAMRSLLSILAGLVVVAGIVSANLWLELRTERHLTEDLRAQLIEERSAARPATLPTQPAPEPASPPVAAQPVDSPPPGANAPDPAQVVRIGGPMPSGARPPTAQQLQADPEYRDALLAQTRLQLQNSYPGLIEELRLSATDADELFNLLAENQVRESAGRINGPINAMDPAIVAEAERLRRENQAKLNASLVALLGDDKYAQYQDYQQTRGARSTVAAFGNTLAQANQPLTAAQARTLLSATATEQQRQQREAQAAARNRASPTNAQDQMRLMEDQLNRQEESNRRMLALMAPHLSSEQLETLRAQFESQTALTRASLRLRRERDRVAQGLQ
jgi:hypothetical protein